MPKKYRKRKPRKKINKSIYKSNINKQHVKVNINTGGSIPSISHMQAPAYPNLTDIKTTVRGTFNDVLNDFIKTQPQPKQPQQQQPYSSNNAFTPTNYNRSQFGEIFNNISSENKQKNPIILQPDEFSFQELESKPDEFSFQELEYKPDSEDEKEPRKGIKDYFKSPFKNNKTSDEPDIKKRNWKKEEEARNRKREEKKKEYEEKFPELEPPKTKSGKIQLKFTKES